jgi:hypothetical protein
MTFSVASKTTWEKTDVSSRQSTLSPKRTSDATLIAATVSNLGYMLGGTHMRRKRDKQLAFWAVVAIVGLIIFGIFIHKTLGGL